MRKLIPAPLIAVLSDLVSVAETHATLDSLFMHAGAPGDPSEESKLVFLLVCGGLALDLAAAKVANPEFQQHREDTKNEREGTATSVEHIPVDKEDNQLLFELAKSKAGNLNKSAQLLYDFVKIALGALIASITNILGFNRSIIPEPGGTDG